MVDLSALQDECDGQTVSRVLEEISISNLPLDVVTIMTLVKKVIPIFPSLSPNSGLQLKQLIAKSFPFLCHMISFVAAMPRNQSEARIYKKIIIEVLQNESCLENYISNIKSKLDRNHIKSTIFGSKLFNVLVPEIDIVEYLNLLRIQWTGVFDHLLLGDSNCGDLLTSMLVMHPALSTDVVFGELVFTGESHFECFQRLLRTASLLVQQRLLNFLLPYLQMHTNLSNYKDILAVLEKLPLHQAINLDAILRLKSLVLQELILRLLPRSQNFDLTLLLLTRFAEVTHEDENVCQLLVIMLRHKMDSAERKAISRNPSFLDAVTKRLAHEEAVVRECTMYIAKLVSNGELIYESDFVIVVPELDLSGPHILDYKKLQGSEPQREPLSAAPTQQLVGLTLSEDTQSIVFIKDLVKKYESHDEKQLVVPLLQLTVRLLRQKKDFPLEVGYYSPALLPSLTTLNNALDELHFEQWRINALVSLLVVTPEMVQHLQRILFTSELSLQQRMSLLSSLGLAARELRGEENGPAIVKPQYSFPSKRLPWDKQQQGVIEENAKAEPAISQIIWRSKRLDKGTSHTGTVNRFRNHAQTFFYPLVHGWLHGIDLGSYDKLFKSHYLKTLTIVYQCCNPHADYERMTSTMLQVTRQALEQGIEQ